MLKDFLFYTLIEFEGKFDLHTDECKNALSNAKAIMRYLGKYFPPNFKTLSSLKKDSCISHAYNRLVNEVKLHDSCSRNYDTMSYCSLFTLLSKHGMLK